MRKLWIVVMLLMGAGFTANAQKVEGGEKSGDNRFLEEYNYNKLAVKERKVVPYPSLREADVVYSKSLYRVIDVREKKNLPLKWEKSPLWKILKASIEKGENSGYGKVKAYMSDSLQNPMTVENAKLLGVTKTTIEIQIDPDDPDRTEPKDTVIPFDWYKIKKYKIKEEWIFDKQRSEFFVRIIGIAPLYDFEVAGMDKPMQRELCWMDYKDLRHVLINEEMFNRQNDAMRLSYLDFFEYRLFSSYVVGENNAMAYASIEDDPAFKDNPMAALYESERIKNDLFTWEHDLWEY